MKVSCCLFLLIMLLAQCSKQEHANTDDAEHEHGDTTQIDYRDTLLGTYAVTYFNAKSHFNTPPFYDSIFYDTGTTNLTVLKSAFDTSAIIINADTLRLGASDNVTKRFLSGCCDALHMVVFRKDSITYTIQDAGSAVSSEYHGWIGKRQ